MGATPMDPTDDELQLKAHVTSTLTDRGVLGKIKVGVVLQLRLRGRTVVLTLLR